MAAEEEKRRLMMQQWQRTREEREALQNSIADIVASVPHSVENLRDTDMESVLPDNVKSISGKDWDKATGKKWFKENPKHKAVAANIRRIRSDEAKAKNEQPSSGSTVKEVTKKEESCKLPQMALMTGELVSSERRSQDSARKASCSDQSSGVEEEKETRTKTEGKKSKRGSKSSASRKKPSINFKAMAKEMERAFTSVRTKLGVAQKRQKLYYDRCVHDAAYEEGYFVFMFDPSVGQKHSRKLRRPWTCVLMLSCHCNLFIQRSSVSIIIPNTRHAHIPFIVATVIILPNCKTNTIQCSLRQRIDICFRMCYG
uniref:Uncharacterized protein n=1 Tax=Trichuris muris TaxID=70415 RepID=A0A5S6PZR2_TRIMR